MRERARERKRMRERARERERENEREKERERYIYMGVVGRNVRLKIQINFKTLFGFMLVPGFEPCTHTFYIQ